MKVLKQQIVEYDEITKTKWAQAKILLFEL